MQVQHTGSAASSFPAVIDWPSCSKGPDTVAQRCFIRTPPSIVLSQALQQALICLPARSHVAVAALCCYHCLPASPPAAVAVLKGQSGRRNDAAVAKSGVSVEHVQDQCMHVRLGGEADATDSRQRN